MTTCGPQPLSWGSVLDRQAWRGHPFASVAEARLWVTGRSLTRDLDLTGIFVAARRVLLLLLLLFVVRLHKHNLSAKLPHGRPLCALF